MYRHNSTSSDKLLSLSLGNVWSIYQSEEVGRQRADREFAAFTESAEFWRWVYIRSNSSNFCSSRSLFHPNSLN